MRKFTKGEIMRICRLAYDDMAERLEKTARWKTARAQTRADAIQTVDFILREAARIEASTAKRKVKR
jgi:hypothetical protein